MPLTVIVLSFARSDGVLDDWSMGVWEPIVADILYSESMRDGVCAAFWAFKTLPSFPDHHSRTPLLQQSRDLRACIWPPSRGPQEKLLPLGVDALYQ